MPRFFFDVHDDLDAADEEGRDLADIETAREEALIGARSIACHQTLKGYLNLSHRIDVLDEARRPLFSVTFDEAVSVTPRG